MEHAQSYLSLLPYFSLTGIGVLMASMKETILLRVFHRTETAWRRLQALSLPSTRSCNRNGPKFNRPGEQSKNISWIEMQPSSSSSACTRLKIWIVSAVGPFGLNAAGEARVVAHDVSQTTCA